MSKIRFTQTVSGGLHVQVPVHTEQGLRTAAVTMLLQDPSRGFSQAEGRKAVAELFLAIPKTRDAGSKGKVEGGVL